MTFTYRIAVLLRTEQGATSVEYAAVMLFVVLLLAFALAGGLDGTLNDVPQKFSSYLP